MGPVHVGAVAQDRKGVHAHQLRGREPIRVNPGIFGKSISNANFFIFYFSSIYSLLKDLEHVEAANFPQTPQVSGFWPVDPPDKVPVRISQRILKEHKICELFPLRASKFVD